MEIKTQYQLFIYFHNLYNGRFCLHNHFFIFFNLCSKCPPFSSRQSFDRLSATASRVSLETDRAKFSTVCFKSSYSLVWHRILLFQLLPKSKSLKDSDLDFLEARKSPVCLKWHDSEISVAETLDNHLLCGVGHHPAWTKSALW